MRSWRSDHPRLSYRARRQLPSHLKHLPLLSPHEALWQSQRLQVVHCSAPLLLCLRRILDRAMCATQCQSHRQKVRLQQHEFVARWNMNRLDRYRAIQQAIRFDFFHLDQQGSSARSMAVARRAFHRNFLRHPMIPRNGLAECAKNTMDSTLFHPHTCRDE